MLVKQRSPNDCVLASIAMAAGKAWDDLWNEDDLAKCVADGGINEEGPFMERAGFARDSWQRMRLFDSRLDIVKRLMWGRRALVTANSLNIKDGHHMLYWDGHELHDPSTLKTFGHLSTLVITELIIFNEVKE